MRSPTHFIRFLTWPVALGLAAWIMAQLPLSALQQSLANLDLSQWLLWIVLNLAVIILLTGRWLVLTRAMALATGFLHLLRVRQAGQLISFVTPGPQFGGEPLQVYWLWHRYSVPGHAAFLAVGLDRCYELWVNFAVLLIAVLVLLTSTSVDFVDWRLVAAALLGVMLAMTASGWVLLRQPVRIDAFIKRLTGRWRQHSRLREGQIHWLRMHGLLQHVVAGQRPALAISLALSLLAWAGMMAEFRLLLLFVDVPSDPTTFVFLFTVVRLAFLLPLPGGIGSVEAALFWAFQALALPLPAAAALIILMRLRDVVILLAGAMVLPGLHTAMPRAEQSDS